MTNDPGFIIFTYMKYTTKLCKYCKEYERIENYELAKADNFKGWDLHHRLELTLDGEFAHTWKELDRLGMYWDRPYFELIFIPRGEHTRIHNNAGNKYTNERNKNVSNSIKKWNKSRDITGSNNPMFGKVPWNKGKHLSLETRRKISETKKSK